MQQKYNFKEVEPAIANLWEKGTYFTPRVQKGRRPYSMFLVPPNASGQMHVGNALMVAIQDILARFHRAKGEPTLWVPGTDHGGYETQVTFEREREKEGLGGEEFRRSELFSSIEKFVARNNEAIVRQVKALGASVDWSRFRFTLDAQSLAATEHMFRKMVTDNLVYRSSYMVNYCSSCKTVLADIELKEVPVQIPRYHIKFPYKDGSGHLSLVMTRPEFLFTVTHVLVHPEDTEFAGHIGQTLVNPLTGGDVAIVTSKRKYVVEEGERFLAPFCPSHIRYDYEYAIRHGIPTLDLLDWEGLMLLRYPGMKPVEARARDVALLEQGGFILNVDDAFTDSVLLCKKGHASDHIIRLTWFIQLDNEVTPLRKPAVQALEKGGIIFHPHWRKKGLVEWIGKMHDWPIARQNVWGIRIPVWYEATNPEQFTVWFFDKAGKRHQGNLKSFLDAGVSFEEVIEGLERLYAAPDATWTLTQEEGKRYLPETDTFDTWFSSGAWSTTVFGSVDSPDMLYFYPHAVVVIGHDLLRLSISRKIILSMYLTGKLPFRHAYFHRLLKGGDGQKMSKSLGNAVALDHYLATYGADVTRMALVSCTVLQEDFVLTEEKLTFYTSFAERLWNMGRVLHTVRPYTEGIALRAQYSGADTAFLAAVDSLAHEVGLDIDKHLFAQAQEKVTKCMERFESYANAILGRDDAEEAAFVFATAFKKYLVLLHPFMPFMTEELYRTVCQENAPLAVTRWPASPRR